MQWFCLCEAISYGHLWEGATATDKTCHSHENQHCHDMAVEDMAGYGCQRLIRHCYT